MVSVAEILKGRHTGKEVELRGWIYRTRSVGGKGFVVVRDATGIVQVALSRDSVPAEAFAAAEKALIESAVVVHGKVVEDKRAPGGFEIRADDFKVVHFAEKFPIQEDLSEEFLLDVRHLWVRSQRMTTIFRIRHTTFGAVHEYFRDHGFWEVHPPMITPSGSEGGSTLFELDYFGRKAHLTQSWQLYAEALVLAMDVIGGDGVGEIVGGSERETDLEAVKKGLKEQGEDPKAYDWYLDSRRFGSVQHAGFGMGMERLIQWICKLDHIRDAVPFPRTPGRFAP